MKSKLLAVGFLSVGLILSSCEEDSATRIKLEATTTSSNVTTKTGRVEGTNDLVFNSGSIVIREVVFDGENGNSSVSRTIPQIATIDYSTGIVSPAVYVDVPAGNYTSVNLGIELQDVGSSPSVVIEGNYTNSNDEVFPVRFEFNSGEVFEANAPSVSIPEGTDVAGKINFDAQNWFGTITATQLDNATLTNGVIIISESSNSNIFDIVADRLDVSTQAVFE